MYTTNPNASANSTPRQKWNPLLTRIRADYMADAARIGRLDDHASDEAFEAWARVRGVATGGLLREAWTAGVAWHVHKLAGIVGGAPRLEDPLLDAAIQEVHGVPLLRDMLDARGLNDHVLIPGELVERTIAQLENTADLPDGLQSPDLVALIAELRETLG